MARFLVAPDSFKGTFDAASVAEAIAAGIEAAGAEADRCPVADGGEGTMAVLLGALGGKRRTATVHDPLHRPIEAEFALIDEVRRTLAPDSDTKVRRTPVTAVVETAQASGLSLVAPEERDAQRADTFGTGELIAAAVAAGAQRVLLAVGGSATTDGGRGAIEALRQSDAAFVLCNPGDVQRTNAGVTIEVLCDVRTPYEQAARVFAPQKGADEAAVERLTERLDRLAAELPRDPRGIPMTGAAGGLSGGLWAHGAQLHPGADFVLDTLDFDTRLARADAVIGGEGRFDSQSLEGKIVGTIATRCATAGKPLHLIVGQNGIEGQPPPAISSLRAASRLEEIQIAGGEICRASA